MGASCDTSGHDPMPEAPIASRVESFLFDCGMTFIVQSTSQGWKSMCSDLHSLQVFKVRAVTVLCDVSVLGYIIHIIQGIDTDIVSE